MKYKNKITTVDNIKFHSKKESRRYLELLLMKKANIIKDLDLQPKISLMVNGKHIGYYIGDFRYYDNQKKKVILEDVKSPITKTSTYNLKKKILKTFTPPIEITEVF